MDSTAPDWDAALECWESMEAYCTVIGTLIEHDVVKRSIDAKDIDAVQACAARMEMYAISCGLLILLGRVRKSLGIPEDGDE